MKKRLNIRRRSHRSKGGKKVSMAQKAGLAPGAMVYVGRERSGEPRISMMRYGEEEMEERQLVPEVPVGELVQLKPPEGVCWLNVDGVHRPALVTHLGDAFGLHPLTQEDIVNTMQRPKVELFDTYMYACLKMIYPDPEGDHILIEQVSLIYQENMVFTFQEQHEDVFQPLRDRVYRKGTRLRRLGADYLFFALMDVVVSNYFVVLDHIEQRMDELEDRIYDQYSHELVMQLQNIKRELIFMRKSVLPLREVISQIRQSGDAHIQPETQTFFRDLADQVHQVVENVDSYRDMLQGLQDLHFSMVSQRMNEVMKVLTIVSTIFIPLSFIAGLYGMNFVHMPELDWAYGYPVILGVMLVVAAGMLYFMRRRRWL